MKKSPFFLIVVLMFLSLLSCDSEISHKEHVWGEQKVTKEATCTEEGEAIVSCSCGETKTVTLEKLGHDIKEFVTEPTPLQKGRIDYKCSRCGISGSEESVELDRSIAGYGVESYDDETRHYLYYKFEEDGKFYYTTNSFVTDAEGNVYEAYMLDLRPQVYSLIESEETVKIHLTYKDNPNKGMDHSITENNGTISTTYRSSEYPQEETKTLFLARNPNLADLPTQIVLNNGSDAQNIIDRINNTAIDWDAEHSQDYFCQYAYWDSEYLKEVLPGTKIFVCYSYHADDEKGKCTVCGREKQNNT